MYSKLDGKSNFTVYCCKYYVRRGKVGWQPTGVTLFECEIGMQLYEENPYRSVNSIKQLIAQRWQQMSAERKAEYNHRAAEIYDPNNPDRCEGRLKFGKVNGQTQTIVDELIGYKLHSNLLSIFYFCGIAFVP